MWVEWRTFVLYSVKMNIAMNIARDNSCITPDCKVVVEISGCMVTCSHDDWSGHMCASVQDVTIE